MKLRKSNLEDVKTLVKMSDDAKDFMKENNLKQWSSRYPIKDTFLEHINKNSGYCIINKNNEIIGYFALILGVEKTYLKTYEGNFKYNEPYGTIHTAMISKNFRKKGYSKYIFKYANEIALKNNIKYLRVDTHKDNTAMLQAIKSSGYSYSAIIKVEDGTERLAFEKRVNINEL